VSSVHGDETNLRCDETIFRFREELRKRGMVTKLTTRPAAASAAKSGDSRMRALSFILAMAFVLAGPSIAGSADTGLPGIGTFVYNGSPVVTSAAPAVSVAARSPS
jgi:hypothetical protein